MEQFIFLTIFIINYCAQATALDQISCDFEFSSNVSVCDYTGDMSLWQLVDGDPRETSTLDGPDKGVNNSGIFILLTQFF